MAILSYSSCIRRPR